MGHRDLHLNVFAKSCLRILAPCTRRNAVNSVQRRHGLCVPVLRVAAAVVYFTTTRAAAQQLCINTLAGAGVLGVNVNNPHGVTVNALGTEIFIADSDNNRIRVVRNGAISTLVGIGSTAFSGDDGPATDAALNYPYGVAVDPAGPGAAMYIADTSNHRVRVVRNGTITTFAGTGSGSFCCDDGPAARASLQHPYSVAVDPSGAVVYIADTNNRRVRVVRNGTITTFAGTGSVTGVIDVGIPATSASLLAPAGVAVDPTGAAVYIADYGYHNIRVVRNGIITTFAGDRTARFRGDGGPAISASLYSPYGVAVDPSGSAVYIADSDNNRIRVVRNGIINTVAGTGVNAFSGDGGPATGAALNHPSWVAVDPSGTMLYIADSYNHRIRILGTAMCNGNLPLGLVTDFFDARGFAVVASLAGYGPGVCLWDPSNTTASASLQLASAGWALTLQRELGGVPVTVPCARTSASLDSGMNLAATCQQVARLTCTFAFGAAVDAGTGWAAVLNLELRNASGPQPFQSVLLTVRQALAPFPSAPAPMVAAVQALPIQVAAAGAHFVTVVINGSNLGTGLAPGLPSAAAAVLWALTPRMGDAASCGNVSAVGPTSLAANCSFAPPHWSDRVLTLCVAQQCVELPVAVPLMTPAIVKATLRWDSGLRLGSPGIGAARPETVTLSVDGGGIFDSAWVVGAGSVRAAGADALVASFPVLPEAFLGVALRVRVNFTGNAVPTDLPSTVLFQPLTTTRPALQVLLQNSVLLPWAGGGTLVLRLPRPRPTLEDYDAANVPAPVTWADARAWVGSTPSPLCTAESLAVLCFAPAGSSPAARVWLEAGGLLNVSSDGREWADALSLLNNTGGDASALYAVYAPPSIANVAPPVVLLPPAAAEQTSLAGAGNGVTFFLTGRGVGTAAAGGFLVGLAVGHATCGSTRAINADTATCDRWIAPSTSANEASGGSILRDLAVSFTWGVGSRAVQSIQGNLVAGVVRPSLQLVSPSSGVAAGMTLTLSGQYLCPLPACSSTENVSVSVAGLPCSVTAVAPALGLVSCIAPALPASLPSFPLARIALINSAGASSTDDVTVTYLLPFSVDWAPSVVLSRAVLAIPSAASSTVSAMQSLSPAPTVVVSGEGSVSCALRAVPWSGVGAGVAGCGPALRTAASAAFGTAYVADLTLSSASSPQIVGKTSGSAVIPAGGGRANITFDGAGLLAAGGCIINVSVVCTDTNGRVAATPSSAPLLVIVATLTGEWALAAQTLLALPLAPGAALPVLPARAVWVAAPAAHLALTGGIAAPGSAVSAMSATAAAALLSCTAVIVNSSLPAPASASVSTLVAMAALSPVAVGNASGTQSLLSSLEAAVAAVDFGGLICTNCGIADEAAVAAECSIAATGERMRLPPLSLRTVGAQVRLAVNQQPVSPSDVTAVLPHVPLPLSATVELLNSSNDLLDLAAGACRLTLISSAGSSSASGLATLPPATLTPSSAGATYVVSASGSLMPALSATLTGSSNSTVAVALMCSLWGRSVSSPPLLLRTSSLRIAPHPSETLPASFIPSDGTGVGTAATAAALAFALSLQTSLIMAFLRGQRALFAR